MSPDPLVSISLRWLLRNRFGYVIEMPHDAVGRVIAPASGADLTFATHPATGTRSECQIQSSTRTLYLLVVLRFLHSQQSLPRRDANVRIGPLARSKPLAKPSLFLTRGPQPSTSAGIVQRRSVFGTKMRGRRARAFSTRWRYKKPIIFS